MTPYFPHQTLEFRIEEPPAFRKFTMSIAEMAIVTGVLFRLYRALAMTVGSPTSSTDTPEFVVPRSIPTGRPIAVPFRQGAPVPPDFQHRT